MEVQSTSRLKKRCSFDGIEEVTIAGLRNTLSGAAYQTLELLLLSKRETGWWQ